MKIEKPRGTRDFSPEDMEKRIYVEEVITGTFEKYAYRRIGTPTFEHVELFEVKSGEEISTHMYVFEDKKGRRFCLRPEATASVSRMFSETLRSLPRPLKLYYSDPMFRYEEPQKGRYREFWQIGLELIGPRGYESDAEVVSVAYESLRNLGLEFRLEMGHLGIIKGLLEDLDVRECEQKKIIAAIDKNDTEALLALTGEKALFELIALKGEKDVIGRAKNLLKGYEKSIAALKDLEGIVSFLDLLGVKYSINLGIARGLEYYTGMVFEIRVNGLGGQNQICGGGRYDGLINLFSGMDVPAVGFAFGFDRVLEAMEMAKIEFPKKRIDIVVAPADEEVRKEAIKIAADLRKDYTVYYDLMERKLGKILEYAAQIDARYAFIVGRKDLDEGMVTVRDMKSGEQKVLKIKDASDALKKN